MFVSHEVAIDARHDVAFARLIHLVNRGSLHGVCESAYEGARQALMRVGPLGEVLGVSKLVRIRVLDPVRRGTTTTVVLRWEATGPAGDMFPVLDADLMLTQTQQDGAGSRLMLVGSYRPPLGRAGALLDKAIMNRVAAATVRSFLEQLATALADPTTEPDPWVGHATAQAPRLRPVGENSP